MGESGRSVAEDLGALHTAAIDAVTGYEEARRDADGKGETALFKDMIALHTRNAADLETELVARHDTVDDHGSFMGAVHKTIMDVRAMFGGLGESVLPGLIDGEKRNIHHCETVLARRDLPSSARSIVSENLSRLQGALSTMEHKAGAASAGE